MKKSVIAALALSLLLFASVGSANVIGVFGEVEAVTCTADALVPYSYVNIYFNALLTDIGAISACEFGATGVDFTGMAIATVLWNTTLVIGDIMTPSGVALAFTAPLAGPVANLGHIQYFVLAPFPADSRVSIVASGDGNLVLVDSATNGEVPATGQDFMFNCSQSDCSCSGVPTDESSWSEVKALY